MSKYESERGTIVIPAASWVAFRRTLIETWNAEQNRIFDLAVKIRGELAVAAKGKRGFDRAAWITDRLNGRCWGGDGESRASYDAEQVIRLLGLATRFEAGAYVKPEKDHAPKRKDLKILPVSRGATLSQDEGTIELDDATHSVTWTVSENNRACESARSMPVATKMFRLLSEIEWTRGSGGKIVGNDEYNRDSYGEGEGGNYVTAEYGPHIKKPAAPSYSSSYGYGFGGGYRGGRF